MKMDNRLKLSITDWVFLVVGVVAVSAWFGQSAPAPTETPPQWLACETPYYKTWCKVPDGNGGFQSISVQDFAKQHGYTLVGAGPDRLKFRAHNVIVFQVEKIKETPQ